MVIVLPVARSDLRLAEQVSMLDHVSDGRHMILGIGAA